MTTESQKNKITLMIYIIILTVGTLSQISSDLYLPSLPAIKIAFMTSATMVQLTMAVFMLGMSFAQLFYGPESDRIGRKKTILTGISLGVFGNLVCMLSPNITTLIIGRLIQGLGVGVCNSVGRSVLRDLTSGEQLAKLGSQVGMFSVFIVASAPTLGGYIQHYFNWRMSFIVLFIYSFILCLLVWKKLPETNLHLNPHATKIKIMLQNYLTVIKNKIFIGYTICSCMAYSGLVAYLTAAPFLFQTKLGFTSIEFGWLSFLMAVAMFIGAFINNHLVVKKGLQKMIFLGVFLMIFSGILMLITGVYGLINAYVILIPMMLFSMGTTLTFANAFAGAFQPFPKMAGSSSAIFGFSQILFASFASAIMSFTHEHNQIPLAIMFTALGIIAFISLEFLCRE